MCSYLYNNHPNKQHWRPVLSKEGKKSEVYTEYQHANFPPVVNSALPSAYTRGQLNHDIIVSFPHSLWVRALREETFKFLSYELFDVLGWWARKGYGENRIFDCFTSSSKRERTGFLLNITYPSSFKYAWQQRFRGAKKTLKWNHNNA